jgi:hypothetical protein
MERKYATRNTYVEKIRARGADLPGAKNGPTLFGGPLGIDIPGVNFYTSPGLFAYTINSRVPAALNRMLPSFGTMVQKVPKTAAQH